MDLVNWGNQDTVNLRAFLSTATGLKLMIAIATEVPNVTAKTTDEAPIQAGEVRGHQRLVAKIHSMADVPQDGTLPQVYVDTVKD